MVYSLFCVASKIIRLLYILLVVCCLSWKCCRIVRWLLPLCVIALIYCSFVFVESCSVFFLWHFHFISYFSSFLLFFFFLLAVLFVVGKDGAARAAQLSPSGAHAHRLHGADTGQQREHRALHQVGVDLSYRYTLCSSVISCFPSLPPHHSRSTPMTALFFTVMVFVYLLGLFLSPRPATHTSALRIRNTTCGILFCCEPIRH